MLCTALAGLSGGAFGSWKLGDEAVPEIEAHQRQLKLALAERRAAAVAAAAVVAAPAGKSMTLCMPESASAFCKVS